MKILTYPNLKSQPTFPFLWILKFFLKKYRELLFREPFDHERSQLVDCATVLIESNPFKKD